MTALRPPSRSPLARPNGAFAQKQIKRAPAQTRCAAEAAASHCPDLTLPWPPLCSPRAPRPPPLSFLLPVSLPRLLPPLSSPQQEQQRKQAPWQPLPCPLRSRLQRRLSDHQQRPP